MRFFKLTVLLLVFVILAVNLCSCVTLSIDVSTTDGTSEITSDETDTSSESDVTSEESETSAEEIWNVTYVVFESGSQIVGVRSNSVLMDVEQYRNYKSHHSKYNTYTYFSTLNDEEKFIYNIFEYAYDNSFSNIYFDEKLLENTEHELQDILYMLSLDSPLVEQNVRIMSIPFEKTLKDDDGDAVRTWNGQQVYVSTFFTNKNENKDQAIKKAEEVIDGMPSNLSDIEKAKYFYKYLGENVAYKDYKPYVTRHYLYDALVGGGSNCDGYANAFSLLCNMAGIKCVEKMRFGKAEGETGHTWTSICLDGVWYNVDATASDEVKKGCPVWKYFGFSDDMPDYNHEMADFAPDCKENMIKPSLSFYGTNHYNAASQIANALKKSEKRYIVVEFAQAFSTDDAIFQKIANAAGDLTFWYFDFGNKYYCVILLK